jgi:hypothetical protein
MQKCNHTIRTKSGGTVALELSRSKAIKAMCTECMGTSRIRKTAQI